MDNLHIDILQQYVDNELDGPERLQIARHLGANAHDRALVESYQAQNEALQRRYGDKLNQPLPPGLQRFAEEIELSGADARMMETGRLQRDREQALVDTLVEQALQAHDFFSADDHPSLYKSDQQDHFVRWFEDTLKVRVQSPSWENFGYSFSHALRLPMADGTAGQITHRHQDGTLLMTYFQVLNQNAVPTTPLKAAVTQRGNVAVYYWQFETILYALVAAMHQDKLLQLANVLSQSSA